MKKTNPHELSPTTPPKAQTLIGVIASFDSPLKHDSLKATFKELHDRDPQQLAKFHFVFTGGTFDRLFLESAERKAKGLTTLDEPLLTTIRSRSTRLPSRRSGGVTLLANFIVNKQCSIAWLFLDPVEPHWLNQENIALMRLCDVWQAKKLMNKGSVLSWFESESTKDALRNPQPIPPTLMFPSDPGDVTLAPVRNEDHYKFELAIAPKPKGPTIALIAHDDMKPRMIDFAIQYENELAQFDRILATGTTGREVQDATRKLRAKVIRCRSGPKGGDIEIATEILAGRCNVVVFFVDPLHPQPHAEDIRVVFGACMVEDNIRVLTNEVQARDWMEHVMRSGKDNLEKMLQHQSGMKRSAAR